MKLSSLLIVPFLLTNLVHSAPQISPGHWQLHPLPQPQFTIPPNDLACWKFVQQHIRRPNHTYQPLPKNVKTAIQWIQKAQKQQQIYWKPGSILGRIQQLIDQHKQGNLFLLFGNNHRITKHYKFFNELWFSGQDGLQLEQVSHLALEAFVTSHQNLRFSSKQKKQLQHIWSTPQGRQQLLINPKARQLLSQLLLFDQQPLIDLYLHQKQQWPFRLLNILNHHLLRTTYPSSFIQEILATLKYAQQTQKKMTVVASDMSFALRKKTQHLACWLYPLREIFSLYMIQRRLSNKRNVIAYMWGARHIYKTHLPRFISPRSHTFSIKLQGGNTPNLWDHALSQLHLPNKMFAIETPNTLEADLLIHFPPERRWPLGLTQIEPISLAYLQKKPQHHIPTLTPLYKHQLKLNLLKIQQKFASCHITGQQWTQLNIQLSPEGNISQLDLYPNTTPPSWSHSCLLKILKHTQPFDSKQSMQLLFRIRFIPSSHNHKQP